MDSLISVLKRTKSANENAYAIGSLIEDAASLHARKSYLANNTPHDGSEKQQFKDSVDVNAPTSPGEIGSTIAMTSGVPYLASRIKIPFLGHNPQPMSAGHALSFGFGTRMLPYTAGFEALKYLMTPLSDPRRAAGRVGYLGSLKDTLSGAGENFGRKGQEVDARYGKLLGVPVRLMHGILNPIAGSMYAGQQIGNLFGGSNHAS